MGSTRTVIFMNDGWDNEIKPKAIDVLLNILNTGIENLSKSPFPPGAYMPIYTTCYNMCTQRAPYNFSEQLYEQHGKTFTTYLSTVVLQALETVHEEDFLKEFVKRWENQKLMNKWMARFFMYLDRYYVKHHALPTLEQAGLQAFDRVVFQQVKVRAKNAMLQLIEKERYGEIVDTSLLRHCVEIFEVMGMQSLSVYTADFESYLLTTSASWYLQQSKAWLIEDSTPVYLEKVEKALNSERSRVARYLNIGTQKPLIEALEIELLSKPQRELIDREHSGVLALLKNDKLNDLARIYRLFCQVENGLEPIALLVGKYMTDIGNDLVSTRTIYIEEQKVKDPAADPVFIKSMLEIHEKFKSIVNNQFSGHALFQKALKDACVEFMNKDVGKDTPANLMSTFCDRILKSGGEKLSEEQVDIYLEQIVSIFGYLTDKDLFAEIYRNQLAKRLLSQRSSSNDAEKAMIGKLKLRCGAQFTGKMEGMMNDLTLGSKTSHDFSLFMKNQDSDAIPLDFSVQVLTTGHWPSYKVLDITMPPDLVKCMHLFKVFYDANTNHRRLQWIHSLGGASIRANYPKKWYDLQVTTLQAVALLLFNNTTEGKLSFPAIRESLNLEVDIVKRILHSLSCTKHKVLNKLPPGRTIKETDEFEFNTQFSSPMRKIRIPMASLEESHSQKHVEEDRSIAIEAAAVRIMKARKELQHQQLISEILAQLAFFKPDPKVIKRRIEALIDRDYLERVPDKPSTYRYKA